MFFSGCSQLGKKRLRAVVFKSSFRNRIKQKKFRNPCSAILQKGKLSLYAILLLLFVFYKETFWKMPLFFVNRDFYVFVAPNTCVKINVEFLMISFVCFIEVFLLQRGHGALRSNLTNLFCKLTVLMNLKKH